jgi:hypothetical protein
MPDINAVQQNTSTLAPIVGATKTARTKQLIYPTVTSLLPIVGTVTIYPTAPAPPSQEWMFDSDFQYNLDDYYGTVEGAGHLAGKATLSAGALTVEGQITINGPLPSAIPEVYLVATDGPDKELAKQSVDINRFSYWQTGPNTYNFTGQIPNVIQPINNGHYEIEALITYECAKYEFFANTNSRISNHYLPLISLSPRFEIGDWAQTTANLNVREGPGLSYAIISTMPTGILGRIVDGPLYGDGYVWWKVHYFMDYVSVVEGWSAENWLELYTLPICNVKLQKNRIEIDKINVWEFFDIYVGDSSSDKPIKAVRFSSDDIQDGIPTGEWTNWFSWDASSGDWDAGTKIKRWAFATPGYKEVWAEVRDELGHAAAGSAKIFVPAPALPVLTSPLVITPTKNIYNVGDVLEAEFTIKNVGDKPITLDKLLVGGRFNGGKLPNGEFPDFTLQTSITLQPGWSYQYKGSLTLTQTGNYHFFVAYYIENPTAEEKKLLDENNWNTNIELGEGLNHKDRVRDIIVLEEIDLLKLEEAINRWEKVLTTHQYPPNLLDDKSFSGRISKCWASFTSYVTRTQLTEKYKELYSAGVEYHRLSYQALMDAENCLENGDVEGARKYLQRSYTYFKLSATSFISAAEVYEANLEAGEILAMGIKEGCEAAVKIGVSVLYPPAATKVDLFYTAYDWAINAKIEGWDKATKDLAAEKIAEVILKKFAFASFDYDTFEDYANLRALHIPIDRILTNEEFLEELGCEKLYDVLQEKLLREIGVEFTLPMFKNLTECAIDRLLSFADSIVMEGKSPIELRVIDKEGRMTGVVNGIVRHEIPMSYYYNGAITIYYLAEPYLYEVAGIEEGHYSLEITLTKEGTATTFQATDIPTSQNVLHQYAVNWTALSLGEEAVTVLVDSNGDGVFEHTFTSDSELTQSEYVIATDDIPPQSWLNIGDPKFVVNGVTYLTSATPIELFAEDDGGSGVASTAYRIYNASYDSGWINNTQPFCLIGLTDGVYQIDYNSTDYAGNVEPTNTVRVILDNTPPVAIFTWTPLTPRAGETVIFNASLSPSNGVPIVSYGWDFGDGGQATGKIVGHAYTSAGIYTVTLKATDGLGSWNVEQRQIEVKAPVGGIIMDIEETTPPILYSAVILTAMITAAIATIIAAARRQLKT